MGFPFCAGAVLTKMDGDSRGGAALSVYAVSGRPIKYVGTGEAMEALEPFYPDRTAQRVLGMHLCCCCFRACMSTHSCRQPGTFHPGAAVHKGVVQSCSQDVLVNVQRLLAGRLCGVTMRVGGM